MRQDKQEKFFKKMENGVITSLNIFDYSSCKEWGFVPIFKNGYRYIESFEIDTIYYNHSLTYTILGFLAAEDNKYYFFKIDRENDDSKWFDLCSELPDLLEKLSTPLRVFKYLSL